MSSRDRLRWLTEAPSLGAIHRWLIAPPLNAEPGFTDFYALSNYTHAFGLLAHVICLAIFSLLEVTPLIVFNVFSVLVFSATLRWSKQGKVDLALLAGGLEIGFHQAFAVLMLGLEAGFQHYIVLLVVGTLFYRHIPLPTRVLMAIIPVAEYVTVHLHALNHPPLHPVGPVAVQLLATMNIVGYVAILMGLCLFFQHTVQSARVHAEKMAQSKTLFLANMSHELRTPLNAILGFAQILKRSENLDEQERRNLATINRSGEYLLELINGILDMSKMEEGKVVLRPAPLNLRQMLADLHSMFELAARNKQVQFRTEPADDLPAVVCADELRLRQILINLLGNALKFTARGHIRLSVRVLESGPAGTARLKFQVEDTGGGISREEIGDLFQLFTQTESGRQSRKGTGLGLALSRRFVELMQGEIGVESEVGRGSTFWFVIPVEVRETQVLPKTLDVRQVIGIRPGVRAPRMLVVDDNTENREVLRQLLSGLGFDVATCNDGAAAVAAWSSFAPDLIWMDLRMPVMDGYAACAAICKQAQAAGQKPPPVIAITASTIEDGSERLTQAGFAALIGKPFRESDIYALIQRHVAVEFIYADAPVASSSREKPMPEEDLGRALRRLPEELQERLFSAATLADFDGVQRVAGTLAQTDAAMAARLTALVENYRFDLIQEAMESTVAKAGGAGE